MDLVTVIIAIIIFILGISLPLLSYGWFPLYLKNKTVQKQKTRSKISEPINEPVTIIFSAHNEESVIRKKMDSIINSDYPKELMRVLIGSDHSTDQTNNIIEGYVAQYPFITLVKKEKQQGKLKMINELIDYAKTECLILTDANVFFEPQTISVLVHYLTHQQANQVGANIFKFSPKNTGISGQEIYYMNMENRIKYQESLLYDMVVGVEGGCYAIQKSWFTKVPDGFLMDDFFITLSVIEKKGKILFAPEAVCYEDVNDDPMIEYKRKVRISLGNFRNLAYFKHLLFPFWKGIGLAFLFHKVFRWLTPFAIIASFIASFILSYYISWFKWITISYILLLILPLLTILMNKAKIKLPLINFTGHFILMNWALLVGFYKYLFSGNESSWVPPKRNV